MWGKLREKFLQWGWRRILSGIWLARMFPQHHMTGSRLVANKGGLRLQRNLKCRGSISLAKIKTFLKQPTVSITAMVRKVQGQGVCILECGMNKGLEQHPGLCCTRVHQRSLCPEEFTEWWQSLLHSENGREVTLLKWCGEPVTIEAKLPHLSPSLGPVH